MRGLRRFAGVVLFASVLLIVGFLVWVELTTSFDTKPIYTIPVVVGAVVGLVLLIRAPETNIGVLLLKASISLGVPSIPLRRRPHATLRTIFL